MHNLEALSKIPIPGNVFYYNPVYKQCVALKIIKSIIYTIINSIPNKRSDLHLISLHYMHFKKSVLLFSIVTLSLLVKAQKVDDVITKYIDFTGGASNWKKVHTIVTSGTYNYNGIEFPFTAYSKAPNQYKFIVPFERKYFAQAFDGKSEWKIDALKGETNKTMLTGKDALAMMNEADVDLESPFINYRQKGHQAVLQGIDTVEGTPSFKVVFTRKNDGIETYFFKQSNFELLKKQARQKMQNLKAVYWILITKTIALLKV